MEGFGPDAVDEEELKRAKLWRDIRAELTRGVTPKWDGNSTRRLGAKKATWPSGVLKATAVSALTAATT